MKLCVILYAPLPCPLPRCVGTGGMADVRTGDGELSEQVPHNPWMGRPVYKVQRALELCGCHETLSLLQGTLCT